VQHWWSDPTWTNPLPSALRRPAPRHARPSPVTKIGQGKCAAGRRIPLPLDAGLRDSPGAIEAATDRLNRNCAPGPPYELASATLKMTSL
jgi:hypothetical protein